MKLPVLGFAAYSGTGKTFLLKKVLPLLREQGVRVGMIKHTHHDFDIDQPGKDSYELRKAGASQMLVASGRRWALMVETGGSGDPDLQAMINQLDHSKLDLILVEGFKHVAFPKIELHRNQLEKPLIYPDDPTIVAFACDGEPPADLPLPLLDLNDAQQIAGFISDWMAQSRPVASGTFS
ncbi:molybdopterin-guanine dinucleotide biosynthesis protein MobB [Sedimenticola thiotaurini]|uniref:Molybdopterin-guanine dinucleotide biosynthesis protein B n=1 Tax=Sedimenticola thiotaurini TaxID=1543721 RepID=A0A0F7JX24_9GAMM|nr:molybdopterin-guanine dinucleotide biosynthesis protein MobB [Sedimenticola thiotaurini]AKH20177.1 molybdopterin-guanine dinucleotide biosynthesis protein B [Sedimenticola thiotaurini]